MIMMMTALGTFPAWFVSSFSLLQKFRNVRLYYKIVCKIQTYYRDMVNALQTTECTG